MAAASARQGLLPDVFGCSGAYNVTFSSGLTLTSKSVKFQGTGTLTGCLSLTDPGISLFKTQKIKFSGSGTTSCDSGNFTIRGTTTWNDGKSTSWTAAITLSVVNGTPKVSLAGKVTAGEFTGDPVVSADGLTINPVACATAHGMAGTTGAIVSATYGTGLLSL